MALRAVRHQGGAAVEPFPWGQAPAGSSARDTRPSAPSAAERAAGAAEAAAASERLAALERDAFVKGYAQGERAGQDAAARQGEATLRRLAETIEEMASLRADLLRRSERELVRLAVAIAERVIRREVSLDRDLVMAMAKVAIEQLGERASATIRLNPIDHAAFLAASDGAPFPGPVEIVPDPAVSRGGCMVRSDFGQMDLDVTSQVTEISRALLGPDDTAGLVPAAVSAGVLNVEAQAIPLDQYATRVPSIDPAPLLGHVVRVVGLLVESIGPKASVGEICEVRTRSGAPLPLEVVGFRDGRLLSVPLGETAGIQPGQPIVSRGTALTIPTGEGLLGRVIDGLGQPIDGKGPLRATSMAPLHPASLNPLEREPIALPIGTGVRAIDALLTCGRGQRVGIFGGSGVGKSTLLGMMARNTTADVVVLGLIGERGREVRGFLENDLGAAGLERSVVVVSTSDHPPLARLRAAYSATAIAESFRNQGLHVLLMMDSVTRFAMAQREVGLAAGEPPTAKGYPPSVFALLPRLLERAGSVSGSGSITAFYTVLVEGDDNTEPISDAVRAILDGHIVLSRELAARNHYPAIDVLGSVSRTMPDVTTPEHRLRVGQVRDWMATLRDSEDLLSVGAYTPGTNPRIDSALERREAINRLLCQPADTDVRLADAIDALKTL